MPPLRALAVVSLFVATAAAAGCAGLRTHAQAASPGEAQAAVQALLDHGARSWNAGALDEFMLDYEPDASTFVTSRGVLRGRAAIRGVYAARFAPGAQRDSLRFEGLEVHAVGPDAVNAIAWYVLHRGDSTTARGPTSLVIRRGADGRWRIVHDHSS